MSFNTNGATKTVKQLEEALGERLAKIRLGRNMTQAQLATEAGTAVRTIRRLEGGQGASLDTLIRVLLAMDLGSHLAAFLPDPSVRPIERVKLEGRERQRARNAHPASSTSGWIWDEDET